MFDIGDKVWVARYDRQKQWTTCPHCKGNKYLTCIMGDGSQVTFDCACCAEGLGRSSGKWAFYGFKATAEEITVTGFECNNENGKRTESYRSGCHGYDHVFATKEEALEFANKQIGKMQQAEKDKLENQKERAKETWAYNVTYHFDQIKRLERDLEYQRTKLAVAESHVKKN